MASEFLRAGPGRAGEILAQVAEWMDEYEYESIAQMKGSMNQHAVAEPAAFAPGATGTGRIGVYTGRDPVTAILTVNRGATDALLDAEGLRRVLAQVEVSFSNSMIEAFWRSLRYAWLYLHNLDNMATLRRLIAFYVRAHNETMPHAAFHGQTPDEMYFGTGDGVPDALAAAKQDARRRRLAVNRAARCAVCA